MIAANLLSPKDIQRRIAIACRIRRRVMRLSIQALAERSGVGEATIKRFESGANISLNRLVPILLVLEMEQSVVAGFEDRSDWSLEELARGRDLE